MAFIRTNPVERYLRPAATATATLERSASTFIAVASRCDAPEAAREAVRLQRELHPRASHHVFAFRTGPPNAHHEGMSDDGEPSGTAGPPVLAALRGSGVSDLVVVVVRYFGGTKLGTGGLVRAYGDACRLVLAELNVEERVERRSVRLEAPYPLYEQARRLILERGGLHLDEHFTEHVTIEFELEEGMIQELGRKLSDLSRGALTLKATDQHDGGTG